MVDRKSLALGASSCVAVLLVALALGGRGAGAPVSPAGHAVVPVVVPAGVAAPHTDAQWEQRLDRQDEILVQQAVAAGCDTSRATKLRGLLREKEALRAKTMAALDAGSITEDDMRDAAYAQRVGLETAMSALLQPHERAALDPVAARAQVLSEEKRRR